FVVGENGQVDDLGEPLPPPTEGQVTTPVTIAGERVGVVVHEPSTLEDAATRAALLAAARLASERARLRADVEHQVEAVAASRSRLLVAEEEERRALAERLDRGAGAALSDVERLVGEVDGAGGVGL